MKDSIYETSLLILLGAFILIIGSLLVYLCIKGFDRSNKEYSLGLS